MVAARRVAEGARAAAAGAARPEPARAAPQAAAPRARPRPRRAPRAQPSRRDASTPMRAVASRGRRAARLARGEPLPLRRALRRVARARAPGPLRQSAHPAASWRSTASRCRRSSRAVAAPRPSCERAAAVRERRFAGAAARRRRARGAVALPRSAAASRPSVVQRLMRRLARVDAAGERRRAPASTDAPRVASQRCRARRPHGRRRGVACYISRRFARACGRTRTVPSATAAPTPDEDPRVPGQGNPCAASACRCRAAIPAFSVDEAVEAAQKLGGSVWVVKAQIHAGGRGKGGGVKLARSLDEVATLAGEILGMQLEDPPDRARRARRCAAC